MIEVRHIGVYVVDLVRMEDFYQKVFLMKIVQSQCKTVDILIDAIVGKGQAVYISKLITPHGCETGSGDMLELLQVEGISELTTVGPVYQPGTAHVGFGVDDIAQTVQVLLQNGGKQKTGILQLGNNQCCFCTDPEGNWLELIQRNVLQG